MDVRKVIKWGSVLLLLSILLFIYKVYDPLSNVHFPKCPFRVITGYKCPGCGSQTTIHSLLNFDFLRAFRANAMLVLSIPYLFIGFIFDMIKNPNERILRWRKRLFGEKAIYFILVIIVIYSILRNLSFCQFNT